MGGVSTPGGEGMNVDVNVVPFIDLLSALVLFLLLGAVWVNIASLKASVEGKGPAISVANVRNSQRVNVTVTHTGYALKWPKGAKGPSTIAKTKEGWNREALAALMKQQFEAGAITSGAVTASDRVPYGELVSAIDMLKEGGLTSVGLKVE